MDRAALGDFVESDRARSFVLAVIVLNAVVLGLETSRTAMAAAGPLLVLIDRLCLAVFVVEIGIKLVAFRWSFFRSGWNVFDFVIVGVAMLPASGALSVLRALRILRVLRAISVVPSLRRVVEGLISALPGMASVFALMALIFYVSAVMATKLFGADFDLWFGTLGRSAYTLFQIMTLEGWSDGVVRPVMEVYPWAWTFFIVFILVTAFAVVNLVVGLVVNSMQEAHSAEAEAEADEYRETVLARLTAIEARLDLALGEPKGGRGEPAGGERERHG